MADQSNYINVVDPRKQAQSNPWIALRHEYEKDALRVRQEHFEKTGTMLDTDDLVRKALLVSREEIAKSPTKANNLFAIGSLSSIKARESILSDTLKYMKVGAFAIQEEVEPDEENWQNWGGTNAPTTRLVGGTLYDMTNAMRNRINQPKNNTVRKVEDIDRFGSEIDDVIQRIGISGRNAQESALPPTSQQAPTSRQGSGQSVFSRIDQMLGEVDQVEQNIRGGRERNVSISPDTTLNWTQIPEAPVYDPQNFAMQGRTRGMMPQEMEMPQDDLHARQRNVSVSPETAFNFDTEKGLSEGMKWVYGVGLGAAQGVSDAVGGAAIYAPRVALKGYLSLYDMLFGTNQAENNAIMKQIDNAAEFWSQETGKMEVDPSEEGLSKGQQFVSSSVRAALPSIIFGAMAAGMMGTTKAATTPLGQSMAAGPFGKAFPTLSKYLQGSWSRLAKMTPFGVRVLGGTARQAEEEGATVGQQLAVGSTTALAEMLTEMIPFELAMDTINILKKTGITDLAGNGAWRYVSYYGKLLTNSLKTTIFEGLEEVIMEPMGNFIEKSIYKPEMKFGEVVNPAAMKEAFVGGIGMMLVMAALGLPGASASFKQANRIIRADNAEAANKKALAELGESIGRDAAFVDQMLRISEGEDKSIKLATPSGQIVDGQLVNFNFVTGDMQVQLNNGQAMRFTMEQVGEAQDGIINVNTEIEQIAEPVAPVQSAQILPGIENFKQAEQLMKDLVKTDPAQAWELKQQVVQAQQIAKSGDSTSIAPDLAQELKKMPTIGVNSWYPSIVDPSQNVVAETPQMEQVSEVGVAPESGTEMAVGALVSPQVDGVGEVAPVPSVQDQTVVWDKETDKPLKYGNTVIQVGDTVVLVNGRTGVVTDAKDPALLTVEITNPTTGKVSSSQFGRGTIAKVLRGGSVAESATVESPAVERTVISDKGNTGEVIREGDWVVKNTVNRAGKPTEELTILKELQGVEGVPEVREQGDKFAIPYYETVVSVDTVGKSDRGQFKEIVQKNNERINNILNELSKRGIAYSDQLQFGVGKDGEVYLIDFSNAYKTTPDEARERNLTLFSAFKQQFLPTEGETFTYHLTQRPPGPGAVPNGAVDSTAYDQRDELGSWGTVTYSKPLTEQQKQEYELLSDKEFTDRIWGKTPSAPVESAKEPWEMTREEYDRYAYNKAGYGQSSWSESGSISAEFAHRQAVKQALSEGKPVPVEVLKDYPDLKPTDTRITEAVEEAPKVEAPKELPPVQTASTGNKVTVYSEDNKPVEVQYAVVDAGQLITSHDTSLQANPDYPQELQPRGRGKVASEMQITNIASTLNPERLGANPMISDGAPIIGNDGVVETGNGRTIALKRVYEQNTKKAQEYRTWLVNNAEALGLDKAAIGGINNPVLVRIRQTEVDRVAFTQDGNVPTVATMSAGEAATQDSKKLNSKVMSAFVPNEDGRIDTPANRNFVRSFIETVVPKSERGQLIDANGKELTQDGVRRIRNAIFARVYGDANALDKLAEDANVNVKNQITSMVNSAPMLLEMKEGISKGDLFPLDITKDIAEAMVKLSDLRDTNMSVKEYLQQNQLFGDDLSPIGKDVLDVFDRYKRSSTKITGILQEYARMADLAGSPQQDTLFGQNPPTVAEVFRAAVEKVANLDEGQITLFQNQAVGSGRTEAQIGTETTTKAETPAPVKGDSKSQLDAIEAELSKEVDEVIGDVGIPVGQSIQLVGGPGQQAQTGSTYQFADATVGERIKAAHGVTAPNFWQKVKAGFTTLREMSTREFEHLPGGKEYAPLRFALRRLQKQRDVATDRTLRAQQGVLIDLLNDKESYSQFELKVLYNDLKASIEQDPNTPLPFGLTPRKLDAEIANLDQAIQGNTAIAGAISKRTKLWDALIKDYTAAMDAVGFDVSERFKRKDYFRHMVLEYANAKGQGMKSAGDKLKVPTNRSFAKERRGSELDINSNYLESEYEVMAQMFYDIEIAKTIQFINDNYNIIDQVQEDAKIENMGVAKEDRKKWDEFIPEGYVKYFPREGTIFFFADTIDARMAEQLRDGQVSELSITAEQLKTVLAKGGRYRPFVVPNEVALTVDNMLKESKNNPIATVMRKTLKAWKVWQLISPKRYIKYNLRNITGDADAAFVGNPTTFAKLPQAAKELYQVFAGDKGMTPNLKDWFERGGMQTLLQVQEMGDINNLRMFVNLIDKKGSVAEIPTKVWQGYWQKARMSTDYREALLRYAAYLDYMDQLEKGNGKPRNFGASVREEIMALKSNKDKAFELANDLLGAYDKVSVTGQFLREYLLPFWSWKEVNFKRYVQFMKNAAHDGETAELVGRSFMHGLKKSPLIAFRIGMFVLKATALSGMLQAWNHLRFPDEEKELSEDVRNTMHIVLGRDKKGDVLYFTRLGALGDFLEWFGMDGGTKYVKDFLNGRMSIGEIASEMAQAPVNVFAQGFGPQFKILAELSTGRNLFPDVFKPTKIHDRAEHFFAGLGLKEEYAYVKGRPTRPFSHYLRNFVMYAQEEGAGSYYDIRNDVRDYLKEQGKSGGSWEAYDTDTEAAQRSTALYYAKLAVRFGDKDAYERFMTEYAMNGGTKQGYETSLRNMHPLHGLKEEDRKDFVYNFLDDEGRERLDLAEKFYNETLIKVKWE